MRSHMYAPARPVILFNKEDKNEFIWNQIKIFMSPLPISSMHGFWGVGSIAASKA